jgi:DNA (cytosine-5)-methyltransferase 1
VRALGVSIFAGGFSLGVEKHFELAAHLERSPYGVKSWRAYRPGVPVSISKDGAWDVAAHKGKVDFVYGNPPCSPWSVASVGYELSALLEWTKDVLRVGKSVGARVVAIESVRQAYNRGREMYREMAAEAGMTLAWVFVNARDCGLPQDRKRLFIVFNESGVFVPEFDPLPTPRIGDFIAGANREGDPASAPIELKSVYCPGKGVTPQMLFDCVPMLPQGKRINALPLDSLGSVSPVLREYIESKRGFAGHMLHRVLPDEPCPVIYGLARFVHPTEDRLLTLRELSRMQGYPDDFLFEGTQATGLRMLGKTVCPPVGEYLAREVAAHLRGDRDVRYVQEDVFWCATDPMRLPPEPRAGAPGATGAGRVDVKGDASRGDFDLAPASTGEDSASVAPGAPRAPRRPVTNPVSRGLRAASPPVVIEPAWHDMPGPTALARELIAKGEGDDVILACTKAVFGGRTEGPHLFTRKDLERLRERIAKKGTTTT